MPAKELVLWGFHRAHGNVPLKLEAYTASAAKRRTREGWTVGAYAKGEEPKGLALQAGQVRR